MAFWRWKMEASGDSSVVRTGQWRTAESSVACLASPGRNVSICSPTSEYCRPYIIKAFFVKYIANIFIHYLKCWLSALFRNLEPFQSDVGKSYITLFVYTCHYTVKHPLCALRLNRLEAGNFDKNPNTLRGSFRGRGLGGLRINWLQYTVKDWLFQLHLLVSLWADVLTHCLY